MNNPNKKDWVLAGYELFSKKGPTGLKIEVMARLVGKSKSSFYHHFADIEVFTEILLNYHLERSRIIADQERLCKNVVPELLNLLLEIKRDLLFNRQLRIHRNVTEFKLCFEKASREVGEAILGIWAETLQLTDRSSLAQMVLRLSIENFYLQITDETMTYEWLVNYVEELKVMVREIADNKKGKLLLYGSV